MTVNSPLILSLNIFKSSILPLKKVSCIFVNSFAINNFLPEKCFLNFLRHKRNMPKIQLRSTLIHISPYITIFLPVFFKNLVILDFLIELIFDHEKIIE